MDAPACQDGKKVIAAIEALGGKLSVRGCADVIVRDSCKPPGLRNQCAAMLRGATILESACLHGGTGTVLVFKPLLRTPKWMHLTAAFQKEFPGATQVIRSVLKLQKNPKLWKELSLKQIWARALALPHISQ